MNAALPKNPFSTRFTRPEAVAYQYPSGYRLADQNLSGFQQHHTVASRAVREAAPESSLSKQRDPADAADLCHRIVRHLQSAKCGLIVGPHGSGKTTLLYTLMPFLVAVFQGDGLRQVRRMQLTMPFDNGMWSRFRHARGSVQAAEQCLRSLQPGSLLVIDGVEQISTRGLRSLVRKSRRRDIFLLATSHVRVVGLSVLHHTEVDVMLIHSLADRLLEDASPLVVEVVSRELECRDLNACTNLRDLWFELYDIVQDELLVGPMNLKDISDGGSIVSGHGSQHASDSRR
ncbi:MAG: hypothetical protein CMM01_01935 [Rhodopirellula sp.]|nr:hypothetical protein [Rhodopirellula sp.]